MEAYGCFQILYCIYYKTNHVFHKLSIRSASKIKFSVIIIRVLGKNLGVTITLNMFQIRLTMFQISFP